MNKLFLSFFFLIETCCLVDHHTLFRWFLFVLLSFVLHTRLSKTIGHFLSYRSLTSRTFPPDYYCWYTPWKKNKNSFVTSLIFLYRLFRLVKSDNLNLYDVTNISYWFSFRWTFVRSFSIHLQKLHSSVVLSFRKGVC